MYIDINNFNLLIVMLKEKDYKYFVKVIDRKPENNYLSALKSFICSVEIRKFHFA